jgi:hypothetical protein
MALALAWGCRSRADESHLAIVEAVSQVTPYIYQSRRYDRQTVQHQFCLSGNVGFWYTKADDITTRSDSHIFDILEPWILAQGLAPTRDRYC